MILHQPSLEVETTVDRPDVEESQLIGVLVRSDDTEGLSEKIR